MPTEGYSPSEIEARGEAIYEQNLRSRVEDGNLGKFVVMDIASGDYEVDDDDLTATRRILSRHPQGILYGVRIGRRAAYRVGATFSSNSFNHKGALR